MICKQVQVKIGPCTPFLQSFPALRPNKFLLRNQIGAVNFPLTNNCTARPAAIRVKAPTARHCYDGPMHWRTALLAGWGKAAARTTAALAALLAATSLHAETPHPLIDTIWDVVAERRLSPSELIEHAAAARYVLLGEIHDHPQHHRIQLRILEGMLRHGRRPALVMEQYDLDQQAGIDTIRRSADDTEGKLHALGELMPAGWDWHDYAPLVGFALEHGLPLAAGNLSRQALRARIRSIDALDPALEARWNAERQAELAHVIDAGHCGKLPAHVLETIAQAQRLRDAALADAIRAHAESGAVAILGSGHARRDIGVPLYLGAAPALALGMIEVDTAQDPRAYATSAAGTRFDYLWFTTPVQRKSDPCDRIPATTRQKEDR